MTWGNRARKDREAIWVFFIVSYAWNLDLIFDKATAGAIVYISDKAGLLGKDMMFSLRQDFLYMFTLLPFLPLLLGINGIN